MFDCDTHFTLQQLGFDAVIRLTMMVRVRIETGRGCGVELDDAAESWLMDITHYQDCNTLVTNLCAEKTLKNREKYVLKINYYSRILPLLKGYPLLSQEVLDTRSLLSGSSECGLNTSDSVSPLYSPLRYSAAV